MLLLAFLFLNISNPWTRAIQVLNNLKKRSDIIIKKADKGDTTVVETIENYTKDAMIHLSNTKYKINGQYKLDAFPILRIHLLFD